MRKLVIALTLAGLLSLAIAAPAFAKHEKGHAGGAVKLSCVLSGQQSSSQTFNMPDDREHLQAFIEWCRTKGGHPTGQPGY